MTSWHAVEAVEDSVGRTSKLLLNPVRVGFWLKLALVVMLAQGLGAGNIGRVTESIGKGGFSPAVMAAALIILAAMLFIGLVFMYLSAVSKFANIKALVKGDVRLVGDFKEQAGNGLKIFLLEIAVSVLLIVLVVAGAVALIFLGKMGGPLVTLALVIAGVLVFIAVLIAFGFVMWLVTEFTVPLMYESGCGVIEGLRKLRGLVEANFRQFAVYALLKFALGLAAAILVFIISFIFFIAVFIAAVAVGVGAYLGLTAAGGLNSSAVVALTAVGVAAYMAVVVAVSYVVAAITLPVHVFLRYMGLTFLQRVDPKLDLFKTGERDKEEPKANGEGIKVY